jgi:hypothetical protein
LRVDGKPKRRFAKGGGASWRSWPGVLGNQGSGESQSGKQGAQARIQAVKPPRSSKLPDLCSSPTHDGSKSGNILPNEPGARLTIMCSSAINP